MDKKILTILLGTIVLVAVVTGSLMLINNLNNRRDQRQTGVGTASNTSSRSSATSAAVDDAPSSSDAEELDKLLDSFGELGKGDEFADFEIAW